MFADDVPLLSLWTDGTTSQLSGYRRLPFAGGGLPLLPVFVSEETFGINPNPFIMVVQ